MQIVKLNVTGLYGYINKEIDFNSDISLLVGINGSGKTSILNIINWVLKPSLANLCVTEFKTISLSFKYKDVYYEINCKHNNSVFQYEIKSEKETYAPLKIRIFKRPCDIKNNEALKSNLIQTYSNMAPDLKEKKTWDLISKFPNPTIIGLDRNLFNNENTARLYDEDNLRTKLDKKNSHSLMSPVDKVKEVVNREYRMRKNSILELTNNLKNHLIFSTFEAGITYESISTGLKLKLNINQIESAEKRVNDYFNKFGDASITTANHLTITKYFSLLKEITQKFQENPDESTIQFLYGINANQFVKVRRLLKEFENFDDKSNRYLSQINSFLDTINFFLKDSAKQLLFKEDTSELTYNTLDNDGNIITEYNDIKFLSSGEQQILILFSYIAFNSQDGKLFIIDEPELSLHIKWQEDFLEKLAKITPESTQLILATHSPILANKKKEKAILLFPYNN